MLPVTTSLQDLLIITSRHEHVPLQDNVSVKHLDVPLKDSFFHYLQVLEMTTHGIVPLILSSN